MTRIALLALLAWQSGNVPLPPNSARIFVYAQHESAARSWHTILCDGVDIAKIRRGTFFALNVSPGGHDLSVGNGVGTSVDARAGTDSFVRLDSQMQIGEPATLLLSRVDPGVARQEMRFVLYIDGKRVLSPSVSKADPRAPGEPRLKTRDENQ